MDSRTIVIKVNLTTSYLTKSIKPVSSGVCQLWFFAVYFNFSTKSRRQNYNFSYGLYMYLQNITLLRGGLIKS